MNRSVAARGVMGAWLALTAVAAGIAYAAAPIHTGSQATYVHRIQLFDEKGQLITAESKVPYSTRKTCGKCHDYGKISAGWHFQAGLHRDLEVKDAAGRDGVRHGEPFILSDPNAGATQIPTSYRPWAQARGTTPSDLGLTPIDFALKFGAHHPGGGVLENTLDKEGKIVGLSGEPWDKTGALEIDCLMCHLRSGYNPEMRAEQIGYHNFKWAATAAAGLGLVTGEAGKAGEEAEEESDDPFDVGGAEESAGGVSVEVGYVAGRFDAGNFVTLDVTRHIPTTNCLFCHYTRTRDSVGGVGHHRIRDIHYDAGLLCTDCHKNGIDHRIARGDGSAADAARDPDNATLSCQGCHYAGRAAAPRDDHPGLPEFHLRRISCAACHSGFEPGDQVVPLLTAAAHGLGLATEHDLAKQTTPAIYGPVWKRDSDCAEIGLFRYAYPRWWGKKTEKGIAPLPLSTVSSALEEAGGEEESAEGAVATTQPDAKIAKVLTALGEAMGDEKGAKPVFVADDGVYELDRSGGTRWSANTVADPQYWSAAHPVRPVRDALGAGGCTDCHAADAPFYMTRTRIDEKTEPDPPVRSHHLIGVSESLVKLGGWREGTLKCCWAWVIPLAALLCVLHFVTFGAKHVEKNDADAALRRFGVLERWMHLFLFGAFLALFATGLGFLTAKLPAARGGFWTSGWALEVHEIAGLIFAAATAIVTLRWFATAIPARYDWEWVKVFGGYLWIKGHPPAGKFNFGQKMFFWGAMALAIVLSVTGITMWLKPGGDGDWATVAYTIHDIAAILLMAGGVIHLYLCTIANPGTLGSIFTGRVTKSWAHTHHPNWADQQDGGAGGAGH